MLRFKKIFVILLTYFIVVFLYLFFINSNDITIDFFYTNIIFIIFYLVIGNLFIENDSWVDLKLNKYENKECFFKQLIKQFTINIFLICFGVSVLNSLILLLLEINIDLTLNFYYFIGIFLTLEIINAYIIAFCLKKKVNLVRYILLVILLGMFVLGTFSISITPINVFKYILYKGNLYDILLHYSIWLVGAYILINYNSKRVEL